MQVSFTVPGCPVPYQRTGGSGKRRFMQPSSREYRQRIQAAWHDERRDWLTSRQCRRVDPTASSSDKRKCRCEWCRTEVAMELDVYLPDRRVRDLSNIVKAIEDALNKHAWHDDAQIGQLRVDRIYDDPKHPRVEVSLRTFPLKRWST